MLLMNAWAAFLRIQSTGNLTRALGDITTNQAYLQQYISVKIGLQIAASQFRPSCVLIHVHNVNISSQKLYLSVKIAFIFAYTVICY
jgi:hypothetical protein